MNFRRYKKNNSYTEENIFWASMSDLLLGLCIIFIVLFALSMIGLSKKNMEQEQIKQNISKKLIEKFQKENIKVEVNKFSGNIKISDLELFELNKSEISQKGKKFLDKITPIYFDTLLGDQEIRKNLDQIIIEGHTDSHSFANTGSNEENYVKNLNLSTKRASSVAAYMVTKNYNNSLINLLSVNGRSFSDPVIINGKEDFAKSRRVELKFRIKDYSFIDVMKKLTPKK
ncbi:MAG: OmpA family protein [Candidatus Gastranaerophilaceae bacterium]|jgi:chemotaxis protein MotB